MSTVAALHARGVCPARAGGRCVAQGSVPRAGLAASVLASGADRLALVQPALTLQTFQLVSLAPLEEAKLEIKTIF